MSGRFFGQWKTGNSLKHSWMRPYDRAGLHGLHIRVLRHTAATWLGEAGIEYATNEKLLGHKLPGTGELYIHDWKSKLRAPVTTLEETVRVRFKSAVHDERVRSVGSCGQLVDSYRNEQLPK